MPYTFFKSYGSGEAGGGACGGTSADTPMLLFNGTRPAMVVGMSAPENPPPSLDPVAGPSGAMNLEIIVVGTPLPAPTNLQTYRQSPVCPAIASRAVRIGELVVHIRATLRTRP